MPKIKTLTNSQLDDYLAAYQSMIKSDPQNKDLLRKAKCIKEALHKRDLINFDLPGAKKAKKGLFSKIFSLFRKNK